MFGRKKVGMMKKVLFVMDSLYNGGAEKSLVNLLNEIPEDKYIIDLLLLRPEGMFLSQVPENVNLLKTPEAVEKLFGNIKKSGLYTFTKVYGTMASKKKTADAKMRDYYRWNDFYSKKIKKLDGEYDVALAYTSGNVMYYTAEKVNAKKKYVWVHNDFLEAGYPKDIYNEYYKLFNGIVSISDKCVQMINNLFPQYSGKTHMIENITSSKVVKNRAMEFVPEEYQKAENYIVSIGRLDNQKGFDFAIDAAAILKEKNVDFKWFVLGTGPLEAQLNSQISDRGLKDRFLLLGAKENPYPYIKNASVFVQSSRYEGKSVVLDEAKILDAPIVVTNYPTVHDQIKADNEGLIVNMTPEGIADGVVKMLTDKSYRDGLIDYLSSNDYGNQGEIDKYIDLIES